MRRQSRLGRLRLGNRRKVAPPSPVQVVPQAPGSSNQIIQHGPGLLSRRLRHAECAGLFNWAFRHAECADYYNSDNAGILIISLSITNIIPTWERRVKIRWWGNWKEKRHAGWTK